MYNHELSHVWPAPCSSQRNEELHWQYIPWKKLPKLEKLEIDFGLLLQESCSGCMLHSAARFRPFTTGEFHSGYLHHHRRIMSQTICNKPPICIQIESYKFWHLFWNLSLPPLPLDRTPIATKISNQKPRDLFIQSFRCVQSCCTSSSPPFCVANLGGWQDNQDQEQWLQPFPAQTCFI